MQTTIDPYLFTSAVPLREAEPKAAVKARVTAALTTNAELSVVSTRHEFDNLAAEWNDLYDRSGKRISIFQSYNWNWHWCNHYLAETAGDAAAGRPQLSIITIRQEGRLVMIWPLVKTCKKGLQHLSWMGDPVSQYGDVLTDQDCAVEAFLALSWDFILQQSGADLLVLRKVRSDAVVAPLLDKSNSTVILKDYAVSHDLSADGDFDNYAKRHSTKARRNRRRQLRRLKEQGPVAFRDLEPGPEARDTALSAVAMKRNWLAEKGLISRAYADHRFDEFFSAVALGGDHPTGCLVSVVTSNEETAAVAISLNTAHCRLMHIIVYNLAFERFSAGAHHMMETFRTAFAKGQHKLDLLAPNTPYKSEWADEITPVFDYAMGLTVKGKIFTQVYQCGLVPLAKRVIAYIPLKLRRRLVAFQLRRA